MPDGLESDEMVTIYCHQKHRLDGHPVGHRCRLVPPEALVAEMSGDLEHMFHVLLTKPLVLAGSKPRGVDLPGFFGPRFT